MDYLMGHSWIFVLLYSLAIEDKNGHEWIINKNIHGLFMAIYVK